MTKINTKQHSSQALIVFTREPVPGKTKARLMPYLSPQECADLHLCFIRDIKRMTDKIDEDIIVSYTGGEPVRIRSVFGRNAQYLEQSGSGLGDKMANALKAAFDMGYAKAVLIGTDIPELRKETIEDAFSKLNDADAVIGPTKDGGYYLIGMKALHSSVFDVPHYGGSSVLEDTIRSAQDAGVSISVAETYQDIDDRGDLADLKQRIRKASSLRGRPAIGHKISIPKYTSAYLADTAKISVIIPVYNEESTIQRMLSQLEAVRGKAEVIFVDGGSTDRTLEMIGDCFTVLTGAKGRAAQMNLGAEKSSGEILFFLHCDSLLPADFISEIRRCMAHNEYGCFGIRFSSHNLFMFTNRIISNHRAWSRGLPFGDQGIFIDRDLFMKAGMFPELPIMEDYELGLRLRSSGIKPGRTRHRITTSGRRYGKGTASILRTEYKMWSLRRLYRKGVDISEISARYRDIR